MSEQRSKALTMNALDEVVGDPATYNLKEDALAGTTSRTVNASNDHQGVELENETSQEAQFSSQENGEPPTPANNQESIEVP